MKLLKSAVAGCLTSFFLLSTTSGAVDGWLNWRGPDQNGTSKETGLPDKIQEKEALWSVEFPGASTPVIAGGRVYIMGYVGEGADLQEGVGCFDAETGKKLWERVYNDYLSDIIYLRYASSSPSVDPETGNVYMQGTQGILAAFSSEGEPLWEVPMMELFGRLTFPNGRTASPIVDKDLVITRGITANWGAHGPGGDRLYAFDKKNGELVWTAASGARPMDNSFSLPYLTFLNGQRVFIASTGDGAIYCANARTGQSIWRVPIAKAGINASVLVHNNDKVIAIYGTPYEPGQMVAMKIPNVKAQSLHATEPVLVERSQVELWANPLTTSTSSPILVGDRIYVVSEKGSLCAVDVNNGNILWQLPLGIEQRNSSPLHADGKLYVPILEAPKGGSGGESQSTAGQEPEEREATGSKGGFYVIRPGDQRGEILSQTALEGRCFGSPAAYNGKVYVQTSRKLYAFGKKGNNPNVAKTKVEQWPKVGPAAQLQVIPSEVIVRPGENKKFRVRSLDENGYLVQDNLEASSLKWASYVPPTARVRAALDATFNPAGELVAAKTAKSSAGAFEVSQGNLKGYIRGRVLPGFPLMEDFEGFQLSETTTNIVEEPTKFAYPPLPWIGARFKFEVRDQEGTKALTKTIDNKFFQRGTVFLGSPEQRNYTLQADVMSQGNRRKMSEVGIINQRYLITLKGNEQKLEISSNFERLRVPDVSEPSNFKWTANTWYTIKSRVDVNPDGTGVVRAKAWKKGEPEPEKWLLEVPHKTAHRSGSPGLFGFAPQDMRVFIDNISVTANK